MHIAQANFSKRQPTSKLKAAIRPAKERNSLANTPHVHSMLTKGTTNHISHNRSSLTVREFRTLRDNLTRRMFANKGIHRVIRQRQVTHVITLAGRATNLNRAQADSFATLDILTFSTRCNGRLLPHPFPAKLRNTPRKTKRTFHANTRLDIVSTTIPLPALV